MSIAPNSREQPRQPSVLVVDPNYHVRDFLRDCLEDVGLAVRIAERGAEARSILAAARVDLAFVEVMLADEDGISLADHAMALGTKVILMSGHPSVIGRDIPASYAFLQKPFRLKDALRLVMLKLPQRSRASPTADSG